MASTVEENGTQYASNGTQECSEEQGELTAMHNVSTAIQKYALEAMDMSQLEKLRLKEECEILKEFVRKIMEYGGDNYHQIIEKGGLTSLQQRVQEIIKSSEDTTQRQNVSGARFNALKDTATVQSDSHVSNQSKKWEHSEARPAHGVTNAFLARHSEDKHLHKNLYYNKAEEMLAKDMDSMVKMIDSNKAKPYLGDCQLAAMSDPYYQPYSSAFPLPNSSTILTTIGNHLASGTYREGNGAGDSSSSCITSAASTGRDHDKSSVQSGGSVSNGNYGTESVETTDDSLHELKQGVGACAMVERVPRGREEREEFGQEIKRKEREIRAERAHKERERHARELEEARRRPQQQEPVTGQSLWLCEHYQRCCRVCFPCCKNFYSCHRCHNNSMKCDKEARASHATHLKCSYCNYEQKIGEDSAKCRRCGREMSAYFCAICKHFMSIENNPYHCEKCGICRLYKDKLFHCDVCNVCFNKYFQGKHKCRPDSGHDICCICREDVFYRGFVIFPCSHKVHHECAEAMIQSKFNTCPVCRDPYRERLLRKKGTIL